MSSLSLPHELAGERRSKMRPPHKSWSANRDRRIACRCKMKALSLFSFFASQGLGEQGVVWMAVLELRKLITRRGNDELVRVKHEEIPLVFLVRSLLLWKSYSVQRSCALELPPRPIISAARETPKTATTSGSFMQRFNVSCAVPLLFETVAQASSDCLSAE